MSKEGGRMKEEPIGDYTVRIWKECREEAGIHVFFMNWCLQHHFEVVKEFMEFDAMMSGE
jgi:hypothetical protein